MARLPRQFTRLGPIASTYAELQSLPTLADMHRKTAPHDDAERALVRVFLQSALLCTLNATELARRLEQEAGDATNLGKIIRDLCWLESILAIAGKCLRNALVVLNLNPSRLTEPRPCESVVVDKFLTAYEQFAQRAVALLKKKENDVLRAIELHGAEGPYAQIVQKAKICNLAIDDFNLHLAFAATALDQPIDAFVDAVRLNAIHSELTLSDDTAFPHFRLLHQVPELVALFCLDRIAELTAPDAAWRQDHLEAIDMCMEVSLLCLTPLVQQMLPANYHRIRENLGQTSGSDSKTLAGRLFRDDLIRLVKKLENDPSAPTAVALAIRRIEMRVSEWRDLHLNLPRNVLGKGMVRSLIGAKEATVQAATMRKTYWRLRGDEEPSGEQAPPARESQRHLLDDYLLALTSKITTERFPQVQNRTGPFAKELRIGNEHDGQDQDTRSE